jgi:hypothetical protein
MRTIAYVNGPPNGTGFVFLGAPGPAVPFGPPGCTAYVDLSQPVSFLWSFPLDAGGAASLIARVPQAPGLAGTSARLQGAHAAPGGLALTAAIHLDFGF